MEASASPIASPAESPNAAQDPTAAPVKRKRQAGVNDADDMKAKHPELFALLPPISELATFNLTSVFTTEDFKVMLGIRRNLALRELASMLMERLGVQPSPGSQTYMASTRRPKVRRHTLKVPTSRPSGRSTLRLHGLSPQHMLSPQAITSPVSTPRFRDRSDIASSSLADDDAATAGDSMESTEDVVYVHLHAPLEVIERDGTRAMDSTHTSEARTADVAAALELIKDPGDRERPLWSAVGPLVFPSPTTAKRGRASGDTTSDGSSGNSSSRPPASKKKKSSASSPKSSASKASSPKASSPKASSPKSGSPRRRAPVKTDASQKMIRAPPRHCMPLSELIGKSAILSETLQATPAPASTAVLG